MGFCAQCGEIVSAETTCSSCGHGATVQPVSCGEGKSNSAGDEWVPSGFSGMKDGEDMAAAFSNMGVAPAPPLPHAAPKPFHRGVTECAFCRKVISGEALALDDGRIVHSSCMLCGRCGLGMYDTYHASGPRVFCDGCAPAGCEAELKVVHLQDEGDKLAESEWFYSDGDSSEGPVSLAKLKTLFQAGKLTREGYVWGTHMPEGADWAPLSDAQHSRLLSLLGGTKGAAGSAAVSGGVGVTPAAAARSAAASEAAALAGGGTASGDAKSAKMPWDAGEDACAGCGKALGMDTIGALGKKWHAECFVCGKCGGAFADGTFMEKDGMPYHKECFNEMFGSKCAGCGELINGPHVMA